MKTEDIELIKSAVHQYEPVRDFDPEEWMINRPDSFALTNENEDVVLFEHLKDGIGFGHLFLHSRGKEALKAAREFIREGFEEHGVRVLVGLTPLDNKKAKWFNRQLGYKSHGVLNNTRDECEFLILTIEDWRQL